MESDKHAKPKPRRTVAATGTHSGNTDVPHLLNRLTGVLSHTAEAQSEHQASEGALGRLFTIARVGDGQSRAAARLLIFLISGTRFPFAPTEFHRLDHELSLDCIAAQTADFSSMQGGHKYFVRDRESGSDCPPAGV